MEARTGFVFYESYYKILKDMPAETCRELLRLMCAYALYGTEPEGFSADFIEGVWQCVYPSLCKGRTNAGNRMKKKEDREEEPDRPIDRLIEAPPDVDVTEEGSADKKSGKRAVKEELEGMGIVVDCPVGSVDPTLLKKHFEESTFLRETFKSLMKIKRHYKKILSGAYKDVRPTVSPPKDNYMKHEYSREKLMNAVIRF